MRRQRIWLVVLTVTAGLIAAACSGADGATGAQGPQGPAGLQGASGAQGPAGSAGSSVSVSSSGTKHFYVTGVEWKGTTSSDNLDPPSIDPSTLSDGYGFNPEGFDSGNSKNWRVASYVWTPGSMVAYEGDKIDLTFFIINGNDHSTWVEGPDGDEVAPEVEMHRGREYSMSFTASKAGTYRLICNEHEPSMTAYIQVLPKT